MGQTAGFQEAFKPRLNPDDENLYDIIESWFKNLYDQSEVPDVGDLKTLIIEINDYLVEGE